MDVSFSPDGKYITTVVKNGERRTWSAITGELLNNGSGDQDPNVVVVQGIIVDEKNNPVGRVRVSVIGQSQTVITQLNGTFVLRTRAAVGQQILIYAEKTGYKAVKQYHPAGAGPITIILEKE